MELERILISHIHMLVCRICNILWRGRENFIWLLYTKRVEFYDIIHVTGFPWRVWSLAWFLQVDEKKSHQISLSTYSLPTAEKTRPSNSWSMEVQVWLYLHRFIREQHIICEEFALWCFPRGPSEFIRRCCFCQNSHRQRNQQIQRVSSMFGDFMTIGCISKCPLGLKYVDYLFSHTFCFSSALAMWSSPALKPQKRLLRAALT